MTSYSVRRATAADQAAVIELIGELQSAQPPAVRHRWLYVDNPGGAALTWLAVDDASGAIGGLTSFFPFRMVVDGEERLGALGGDGFVRAPFRRRGIGAALHAASRREMEANRIVCMYGAPGAMNVTPLLQGGSVHVGDVVRLIRPLGGAVLGVRGLVADRALRIVLVPRAVQSRLEHLRAGDPRVDEVWRATAPEIGCGAVRDTRFYDWRFVRSPSQTQIGFAIVRHGRTIGVCALERIGDRMRLIDLLAPAARWRSCLRAITAHAHREGADAIECKLLAPFAEARRMRLRGFLLRDAKPFLVMVPEGARGGSLLDPARWFYTQADSDLDAAE